MAASFGVSTDFLDRELAEFIVAGRLTAKIDKVAGIVETNRWASFREPCMPGMLCMTRVCQGGGMHSGKSAWGGSTRRSQASPYVAGLMRRTHSISRPSSRETFS